MRGIALVLMVGLLSLLAGASVALVRMAGGGRSSSAMLMEGIQARLLARSGITYASARLARDFTAKTPATRENQPDDWTYRDGPSVPLEQARNPSYAQSEPYQDAGSDGRYDSGFDSFVDLDGNRRFDAWSGRLRSRHGLFGGTFSLRVEGLSSGLCVNAGVLRGADDNANGVPDAADLDASGGHPKSHPNRRLAGAVNHLSGMLGGSPDAGDRLVRGRPPGGYRDREEVRSALSPADWTRLAPHLAIGVSADPGTYALDANGRAWPESRIPVNSGNASPEVLAALQEGLSSRLAIGYALPWDGFGLGRQFKSTAALWWWGTDWDMQFDAPLISITRREAVNVGGFLASGRPFPSRYDLFRRLDAAKDGLFVDSGRYSASAQADSDTFAHYHDNSSPVMPLRNQNPDVHKQFGFDVPAAELALLVRNQCVNMVADNAAPARVGTWPAGWGNAAARGPYGFTTYDLPRWTWPSGDLRMPRHPGVESGETLALVLEPEGEFRVSSLGQAGPAGRAPCRRRCDAAIGALRFARIRSQADFENLEGDRPLPGGLALSGDPQRTRIQSSPLFSLRSCPDFRMDAAGRPNSLYRCHPFLGDLRLMDRSDPELGSPLLYFPFWEAEQPERADRDGPARASFRGIGPSGNADPGVSDPALASMILTADIQGARIAPGRPGGFVYTWEAGSPNGSEMPWSRGGAAPRGAVEFWTDGAGCRQDNPLNVGMGTAPRTYGAYSLAWSQWRVGLTEIGYIPVWEQSVSVRSFQQGDWHHAAFAFDSEGAQGSARGYLDGILAFTVSYDANAASPGSQSWTTEAGVDEIRLYGDPAAVDGAAVAHALQPRFWETGTFMSALHVFQSPARLHGARWDPFAPASMAAAAGGPDAIEAHLLLYADPAGRALVRDTKLSRDGGWTAVPAEGIRSFRYAVRMDANAAERIVDTPVFEGIAVGYAHRSLAGYREE